MSRVSQITNEKLVNGIELMVKSIILQNQFIILF